MAEYKYSVIRYMPDPIRAEPINIGLIMHSPTERFLTFEFDIRRAAAKLAKPDKESLKHFEEQLEAIENEEIDWRTAYFETVPVAEPNFLDKLADYMGNKIRFEAPRGCLSEDPDETFDQLFGRFVAAGRRPERRVTKRTVVMQVKEAFRGRGVGEYLKSRPIVTGEHRAYRLPLGVRHSHRTYVEVLKLGRMQDKSYRTMAAVGRLWQDARKLPANRQSDLCVVVHYENGRVRDGERLLEEDDVSVMLRPTDVLNAVELDHIRTWE